MNKDEGPCLSCETVQLSFDRSWQGIQHHYLYVSRNCHPLICIVRQIKVREAAHARFTSLFMVTTI